MISIIICSISPGMLSKVKENIAATIGVNFELIAIDNSIAKQGICKVYNEAVGKATFDIVCFIHEDIIIHSQNWGQTLFELLSVPTIGLVGVSGTLYKSAYPAVWSACDIRLYRLNTIQHFKNYSSPIKTVLKNELEEVAILDGVFLATKKNIIQLHSFDEYTFKGYHGYDIDVSLKIGLEYKLVVSKKILLEHISEGNLDKKWLEDSVKLHKKWDYLLPKQIGNISAEQKEISDYLSCLSFLQQSILLRSSKGNILKYYLQIIFFYWKYNRLSYTKVVCKRIFSNN